MSFLSVHALLLLIAEGDRFVKALVLTARFFRAILINTIENW